MEQLNTELLELQNLESLGTIDDSQKARLAELPSLIESAQKSAEEIKSKELQSALAQKEHYRTKFEKEELERKKLEARLNEKSASSTDSIDLIKLGKKLQDYSDEELDFVTGFANSKNPEAVLKALENPYVQQGIQAQRIKVEKEKLTLKPSGKQSESEAPVSIEDALTGSSDADMEKLLKDTYGYDVGSKARKT